MTPTPPSTSKHTEPFEWLTATEAARHLKVKPRTLLFWDSTDDLCLYNAFRTAQLKVADFKAEAHPERLPYWY